MTITDRFNDLGPDVALHLVYDVGLGWYGWASVYVGGMDGYDVRADLDATYAFDNDTTDLLLFLDTLYDALAAKVAAAKMVLGASPVRSSLAT